MSDEVIPSLMKDLGTAVALIQNRSPLLQDSLKICVVLDQWGPKITSAPLCEISSEMMPVMQ